MDTTSAATALQPWTASVDAHAAHLLRSGALTSALTSEVSLLAAGVADGPTADAARSVALDRSLDGAIGALTVLEAATSSLEAAVGELELQATELSQQFQSLTR